LEKAPFRFAPTGLPVIGAIIVGSPLPFTLRALPGRTAPLRIASRTSRPDLQLPIAARAALFGTRDDHLVALPRRRVKQTVQALTQALVTVGTLISLMCQRRCKTPQKRRLKIPQVG
jgi:hypothetical protein